MFSRNIFIKWRHESILFRIVYANNISIRIIKTLHKSSFPKVLSYRKFYPKYQALFLFFHPQLFLLINTTFIPSKYCIGEIMWSLLHSWRNVIPCREMWLLQTLYNMVKVTPFLKNWRKYSVKFSWARNSSFTNYMTL